MVYLRQETQSLFFSANWRSMIAEELSLPAGRCFRPQGDGCVAFWTVLTVSIRSAVCTVNPVNTVTKKPPPPDGVQVHDRSKNRGLSPQKLVGLPDGLAPSEAQGVWLGTRAPRRACPERLPDGLAPSEAQGV